MSQDNLPELESVQPSMEEDQQPSSTPNTSPCTGQSSSVYNGPTPILNMRIECPPTIPVNKSAYATVHVTYQPSPGDNSPPIIFHRWALFGGELYRKRDGNWEFCESEVRGFGIYDDPDVEVSPGQNERFISLQSGESWIREDYLEIPSHTKVGDVFKYSFPDTKIDWWDVGTKQDHIDTRVKLPCWMGGFVVEPRDNGGRPTIMVPSAESEEFTVV